MAQVTKEIETALEKFEEIKELRESMLFQWKKSNLAGALGYLDKIIKKTDEYFIILQNLKIN